ncbi:DUF4190 domain-containing protein [Blastococcus sp. TML/M2B]|uniref:DUF4190 domain-containing protein n=1 Tax=unclassified Blastococcus TaxID=2619396 RepID=UPI00190A863C|nr:MULTISPECIES: DUF4190 domain-containing protein [unclassified Blastococcus]MBN1091739.1 DUF4190 domain-containing protein [Blastococcus sp. TML/M2B]MBN1094701.1 DUF4190 domain-containing protein [Blastococcus sp. TML/C7B]
MSTPDDGPRTAPGPHPGPPPYGQQPFAQPGYGQPPHGQPQYAPPQYGPPVYGSPYPPGYGYGRPTNSLAILSLVLAFVFAPAGLITGIIARRQIRETHEGGDGLALAGIIVGGIATALFALVIVFWVIAFASLTSTGFS